MDCLLIASIPTVGLLIVGWLLRATIVTRLAAAVGYEYDEKLETLKSDMTAEADEVKQVRSIALEALSRRNDVLLTRKIEGVDQLWGALCLAKQFYWLVMMISVMNVDQLKKDADKKEVQEFFKLATGASGDVNTFVKVGETALPARPWVTDMAWAYFSAYQSIIGLTVATVTVLKLGMNPERFLDPGLVKSMIREALPDVDGYADLQSSFPLLLNELEKKLINELKDSQSAVAEDRENHERAQRIIASAAEVTRAVSDSLESSHANR